MRAKERADDFSLLPRRRFLLGFWVANDAARLILMVWGATPHGVGCRGGATDAIYHPMR